VLIQSPSLYLHLPLLFEVYFFYPPPFFVIFFTYPLFFRKWAIVIQRAIVILSSLPRWTLIWQYIICFFVFALSFFLLFLFSSFWMGSWIYFWFFFRGGENDIHYHYVFMFIPYSFIFIFWCLMFLQLYNFYICVIYYLIVSLLFYWW